MVHPDELACQVRPSPSSRNPRSSSSSSVRPSEADAPLHAQTSGHLATIACTLFKFNYDQIEYTREYLRVPDGGTIAVDIAPPVSSEPIDDRPILVVAHGLTGGSHESYVRNVLAIVTKPKTQGGMGWRAAVVNSRGCAGAPITSPKLYKCVSVLLSSCARRQEAAS